MPANKNAAQVLVTLEAADTKANSPILQQSFKAANDCISVTQEVIDDLAGALTFIEPDFQNLRLVAGQLNELGSVGHALWLDWFRGSSIYSADDEYLWNHPKASERGYTPILIKAKALGWVKSVAAPVAVPVASVTPIQSFISVPRQQPVSNAQLVAIAAAAGDQLLVDDKHNLLHYYANLPALLSYDPAIQGAIGFDELEQAPVRLRPWTVFGVRGATEIGVPLAENDITVARGYFERTHGLNPSKDQVFDALYEVAKKNAFDPLKERLNSLRWDGKRRMDSWLVRYAMVDPTDQEDYIEAAGRCFLIGAVARVMEPGCKNDVVLTLEGEKGAGKSTLFQTLAEAILPNTFSDHVSDLTDSRLVREDTAGKWLVELGELASIKRNRDVESLKAALTRQKDTCRCAYARTPTTVKRRFVFCGTTNPGEFPHDPSGALARRFMFVKTTATEQHQMPINDLARDAEQLWAEAVHAYRNGAKWFIANSDGAAFQQWLGVRENRKEESPVHNELLPVLQHWLAVDPHGSRSLKDIACDAVPHLVWEPSSRTAKAIGATLQEWGLVKVKSNGLMVWRFTPQAIQKIQNP